MSKYFSICGYYKDDQSTFDDYIVKETDDINEETDDFVFYYGMSEDNIKKSIESKGDDILDFVITSYKVLDDCC